MSTHILITGHFFPPAMGNYYQEHRILWDVSMCCPLVICAPILRGYQSYNPRGFLNNLIKKTAVATLSAVKNPKQDVSAIDILHPGQNAPGY